MLSSNSIMTILLLDIEGTVCPITFVKEELFPYFLREYGNYLSDVEFPILEPNSDISRILHNFPSEFTESKEKLQNHIDSLVKNDVKDPTLKSFQGIVWKLGYDKGDLKAPLYPDAIKLLQSNRKIFIYSLGSVAAQKLLFQHVDVDGRLTDFTPNLLGYFDITTSGFKQDPHSYTKIAQSIGAEPKEIDFYSDNVAEVQAAIQAGMTAHVVVRPGNAPLTDADRSAFDCISQFNID